MVPDVSYGMVHSCLMRPGNLTSCAMMEDMAMINGFALMIKWVMDMMNHTYVFDWSDDPANTENREELSREGDDSIIYYGILQ